MCLILKDILLTSARSITATAATRDARVGCSCCKCMMYVGAAIARYRPPYTVHSANQPDWMNNATVSYCFVSMLYVPWFFMYSSLFSIGIIDLIMSTCLRPTIIKSHIVHTSTILQQSSHEFSIKKT